MTPAVSWLAITAALGGMASLAIWSRKLTRARGLSVAAFLLASPLAAIATAQALGWAIPYWPGITVPPGKHLLLGHKLDEPRAIYVLLDIGDGSPRHYSLEWSTKTAEAIQKAAEEGAEGEHGMHVPTFEWAVEPSPPQFWAAPQPMMPPKAQQEPAPHFEGEF